MSETTNETFGGGEARATVEMARTGSHETIEADDTRSTVPSRVDVARGAQPATWGGSTSSGNEEKRSQPEAAGEFGLVKAAEALGLPAEKIESTRRWATGAVSFSEAQTVAFDATHQAETAAELRGLWGDQFDANVASITRYLGSLPAGAGEAFLQARDDTGRALANDPAQLQRVLGMAQRRGGQNVQAPPSSMADVNAQIAGIEQTMRTDRSAYNRDDLMQARYRELLTLRQRSK
jgi:hypothetical protein